VPPTSTRNTAPASTRDAPPASTRDAQTPTPPAPKPGELEFRAGIAALRANDAPAAAKSFATACTAARGDALAEDACFWVGAAAKRAGQTGLAREALTRFLDGFASSSRAGEASALLGWLHYEAGELDAAAKRFERAAQDNVPKIRESAERGLEAINRKRASTRP
jgi:TolA-binding protein